ncbi:chemotaxis-specific protein-glutamate methyltransferase CheB [Aquabacterium sp. A3]|uniref:chemotaxis-specific protein-glutamate methyltransferase CheB n=1 Tax=Aquabacterium sp. A3 TaxID=3132829 RepID=UPI00311A81B2
MAKVLVVDDSALMRRLITGVLNEAGHDTRTANNGTEAVETLVEWQPDVVTLDINMPRMDGLTALSLIMAARPTPVIMVSSLTEEGALATLEALALGAVDFITKPGGTISLSIDDIAQQLLSKVRAALRAHPKTRHTPAEPVRHPTPARPGPAVRPSAPSAAHSAGRHELSLVVVGVSTGGPRTLEDILPALPADFPCAVLVAQHMPPNFTDAFARRMDRLCAMPVTEVNTPRPLEPGHVYIGQGGTDMIVMERLGRLVAAPKPETPGHPWHPSVDVLVNSAMRHLPPSQITGVQLTGMGDDGAKAMTELKRRGGRTIAEAESTAVVFGMPQELIEAGGASVVLPCHQIARQLLGWLHRKERTRDGIAKSH